MDTRHRARVRSRRAAWALPALLWLIPYPAAADPFLGRLDCVSVQASVWEVGDSFGITTDVLREAIQAGLKTHAPRLKVQADCPDRIECKVFLQNASTDTFKGFFGHVAVEVTRKAIFQDTALLTAGRAWDPPVVRVRHPRQSQDQRARPDQPAPRPIRRRLPAGEQERGAAGRQQTE
ncbi:MAG: hypothetical protein KatS3mg082_2830 [Nitrospiraceae bacterium]|nr:MAG: hypothetical protein KatS3mg082_2830 [Nitrospiraceae bacterium]